MKRTQRKRAGVGFALVASCSLVLMSCSPGSGTASNNSAAPNRGDSAQSQTVTIGSRNIATNLDAAQANDNPSMAYAAAVYETLVGYDSTKEEYVPELATSWKISKDAKTYTFKLRRGVQFHDGGTLSATGIKSSLKRTIAVGKGLSYLLDDVSNVEARSKYVLSIGLSAPDSAFLSKLNQIFIMSPKAIQRHNGDAAWFAKNDAGSGPYRLVHWTPNNRIKLRAFKAYWRGWEGPHVRAYNIKVVDPSAESIQLQQGAVDMADSIPFQEAKRLKSMQSKYTVKWNQGLPFYLTFNLANPKLKDVRVRKAVCEALPYDQIVNKAMYGFGARLKGPVPDWMNGHNDSIAPTKTDPDEARKLLRKAGYGAANPLELELLYFNGLAIEKTLATIIQSSLKKVNVDVSVRGAPWSTLTAKVAKPETRPDLSTVSMSASSYDPGPLLEGVFDPAQKGNWTYWGYNNGETTKMLRNAAREPDPAKQTAMYKEIQEKLVSQYPACWLTTFPDVMVMRSNIDGFEGHDFDKGFDYYKLHRRSS